jgi:hypothetical protein
MMIVLTEGMSTPDSIIAVQMSTSYFRSMKSLQFLFWHLSVRDRETGFGNQASQTLSEIQNRVNAVVNDVDLSAACDFTENRFTDDGITCWRHEGAHRRAVDGWSGDDGKITHPGQCQIERAGDGRGGHGQDIDVGAESLEVLLVGDPEAMLLVDDDEAEALEGDVTLQQSVSTDHDVDGTSAKSLDDRSLFALAAQTREHLDAHGIGSEPLAERVVVLKRENSRRDENGDLIPVIDRLEGGAQRDFSFAETDVSAQEAIHRPRPLHVGLYLLDGAPLIRGFLVGETLLEFAIPLGVGAEGNTGSGFARSIELQQFEGEFADCLADTSLDA